MSRPAPSRPPVPLVHQIRQAEHQILVRKQLIGERASHIGKQLHSKLSSPWTLLGAVATGFLIERFVSRFPRPAPVERRKRAPPGLLASLTKIFVFARSLATAVPSTIFSRFFAKPEMQSGPQPYAGPDGYAPDMHGVLHADPGADTSRVE